MDFFQPVVEEAKWNKNFSSVLAPFMKAERELFNQWADGFVNRDGKLLAAVDVRRRGYDRFATRPRCPLRVLMENTDVFRMNRVVPLPM